jgi:hypothetical protein
VNLNALLNYYLFVNCYLGTYNLLNDLLLINLTPYICYLYLLFITNDIFESFLSSFKYYSLWICDILLSIYSGMLSYGGNTTWHYLSFLTIFSFTNLFFLENPVALNYITTSPYGYVWIYTSSLITDLNILSYLLS